MQLIDPYMALLNYEIGYDGGDDGGMSTGSAFPFRTSLSEVIAEASCTAFSFECHRGGGCDSSPMLK